MILLALAQPAAILKISSINTQRTAIFIHSLAAVNYLLPRSETLIHLPPFNILEKFKDFFACIIVLAANYQHPKIFKDFFACKIVLAANHQLYPGSIQRLSGQQKQQSTAGTCSSNQQQQPAAANSSSNQQQQSTAAINNTTSSNNQHLSYQQHLHNQRRRLLVIITVPSRGYILLEVDLGLVAR